jgi:carboxylesterase
LKIKIVLLICLFVVFLFAGFYLKTGFLKKSKIDERDLQHWQYDENGVIQNAEEFTLPGDGETCWYFIHGYTSTPDEFRELAEKIHQEYDETAIVTRLKGCGEVPSAILNLTLDDWYEQVSAEFDELQEKYEKINVVGFSFGGALACKLAEEKEIHHLYLVSPYLFATYKWYRIFKSETYLQLFSDLLIYSKKNKIAQINSPEGLEKHIAYWNMPFAPVKDSQAFFDEVKSNLKMITNPVLLQQSKNDQTSDLKSSIFIYENISSPKKELAIFEKSNHVIMADYDKEEVIQNIINFEKKIR